MGIDYNHYYTTGEIKTNGRGKRKKMDKIEEKLAISIAKFLKDYFPVLVWRFDVGADLKLEIGSAVKTRDYRWIKGDIQTCLSHLQMITITDYILN